MALTAITPRDRLARLTDLGRKTLRYWWLVAVFAVVGGGLSLAFAMLKGRQYQSWSTLFYQERIESKVFAPGREEVALRNIGDKYRELLVARPQLEQVISDPKLDPYPDEEDTDMKIDMLRTAVKLEVRGGNAFRIVFTDADPNRAKAVVERLTSGLQKEDDRLRSELAERTVRFATEQKEKSSKELRKREQALAEFLSKHPEFVQDTASTQEGAGIRAIRDQKKPTATGNPKLYALERQRQRIQARLDAPPDAPPVRIPTAPSPERIAAEAAVSEAQREVNAATRELEDSRTRFTDKHPTTLKAQERLNTALQRLRQAQAAVPPDNDTVVAPASPEDRVKLQKELRRLEEQINDMQRNAGKPTTPTTDQSTNWVVELETEHGELRRDVAEERARVSALADSVFRATMDASQKDAEAGGRLSVVDPAFKPVRPSGPGKTIFLMAGMVLFVGLGVALAIGLAVIDDRLYRRGDLDLLGITTLAVIPRATMMRRPVRPATRPARKGTAS